MSSQKINDKKTAKSRERVSESARVGGVASWYNAKYSSIQQNQGFQANLVSGVNQETGEIIAFSEVGNQYKKVAEPESTIVDRYALQSVARRLLWGSRTAKCLRLRRVDSSSVEVWRSKEHKTAHFAGLQTCGSVWACPVCAAKISERRRVELLTIMEQHKATGGDCLLLTLTNPHTAGDDLNHLLKAQALAMSRMNSNRFSKALWSSIGTVGTVRAYEVTHGVNGFHPHFHILIFCNAGLDLVELQGRFYDAWANSCRLAKLPQPSKAHGVRLDGGENASKYVTKGLWGLDSEMTKGHIKKASKGRSPFDLLRSALYDDDKQACALFLVYANAFKGKRQLQYSNGLKALYAVEDLTDDEVVNLQDDQADLLGNIEPEEWRLILRYELRADVLILARQGWGPVRFLIDELLRNDAKMVAISLAALKTALGAV